MWNAIQGVANKASKLAVEVLDPGTHENSNSGTRQTPSTTGTATTDRLSALKARYKASESDRVAPVLKAETIDSSTTDTRLGSGILTESSEVKKLRSQLEKLKEEMMRQNTISDDQLKQQNYQYNEQIKQKEIQHKMELDHSREEITQYFQNLLKAKDQELVQSRNGEGGGGCDEKGLELESRLEELNSENTRLKTEVAELQQNGINAAFGLDSTPPSVDSTKLQEDYNKLQEDYKNLQESTSILIPSEALTERDAFWQKELERVRSEGQGVREDEMMALQESYDQERKAKEEAVAQRCKKEEEINRLEHSLQERDSVWQQELISNQNSQLEIKKHYEAIKVELSEIKDQKQELENSVRKLETAKKNEMELRTAAESHVKSLQRNMQEMGSDASNFKQQLADSMSHFTQMQDQHSIQIQSMEQDFQQRLNEQQTSHQHLTQVNQELTSRLESKETEHQRLLAELESVKTRYLANGEELDISKMSYDLESASENLRLSQTKNSLLSHEVESLTKELEDLRQIHSSSESIKESSGDAELIQRLQNERDGSKQQLKRLKQQLIQMEEDQEASILWRIDAEVKLALEAYKQQESFPNKLQLESALEQAQKLSEEYRLQCESKTQEISNLQVALGELTYHGEAADKLRRDLRLTQEQIRQLEEQLIDAKASIAESNSARKAAEATADEAHRKIAKSEEKIINLETSLFNSKKELLDTSQKLQRLGNDAHSMVDRRLVVQLLVTYLEKRHSQDALEVMARMLGFTEEEKNRIGVKSKGRGLLGSVAGGTLALVKGGMSVATLGLLDRGLNSETGSQFADEWVDFLTKEEHLKTPQEQDPLAYLQQGGLDSPKRRPLSYFDDQSKTHSPYQNYHRTNHSPSQSSKSEIGGAVSTNPGGLEVGNRVQNWRPSGTGGTSCSIQPFSGSIPSFKDYIEQQHTS